MLKRTRSFFVLSLAVAVIAPLLLGAPSTAQAQFRRIMVEEFTGAWCGYCPRGALAIQQLKQTYPGQVIAVSIHNDNNGNPVYGGMDVKQGDTLMAGISSLSSATAVSSFPNGWTARTPVGAIWLVDPGAWIDTLTGNGLVEQMLGQKAAVTVSVDQITYNASTGTITARVNAKFNQAMTGDLRFNLYVIEDSVTGTGTGYDQHNYFYTVPGSPYYNVGTPYTQNGQPDGSTIPGFEHMQVFRYSPGPIWGTTGVIPSNVASGGSYSHTYTFQLPLNILDPTHVKLIGFVSEYSATNVSGNQILDADQEPLIGPGPKYLLTSISIAADNQFATAKSNSSTSENINFTNNGPDPVTLSLAIDPADVLPNGWSAAISPTSITVNGGATGSASLNVTAPEQSAYIGVTVLATPVEAGYLVSKYKTSVNFLSDNTRYALYNAGSYENAVLAGVPDSVKLHMAIMPLTNGVLTNYDYTQFGAVILNNIPILDFTANLGLGVDPSVQLIEGVLDAGNKVFLNSDDAMFYAFDQSFSYYTYTETQAVQDLFARLGLSWTRTVRRWNQTTNALTPFPIKGTTNDSIGNEISVTDAGGFLSEIFSIDSVSIPVFYSDGATKNVLGARYEDPTTHGRLVYLGFGLSEITNQKLADTIAARSIAWLFAGQSAPSAGLTANPSSLDFGVVAAGQSLGKSIVITNSGNASITLNSITVNPSTANFYPGGFSVPTTIDPGASKTLVVTFAPVPEGDQTATLVLNASEGSNVNIALHGATSPSSVRDGLAAPASLNVSPNPFHGMTQIQYVAGQDEHGVSLAAYDLLGREVAKLATQSNGGNIYTALFDGSKLADGTYVIVAHSSTGTHEVRVVNQQ